MTELRIDSDELDFESDLVMLWEGKPFTGVATSENPDGSLCEERYVDGLLHGISQSLSPCGRVISRSPFYKGLRHGYSCESSLISAKKERFVHIGNLLCEHWESDGVETWQKKFAISPDNKHFQKVAEFVSDNILPRIDLSKEIPKPSLWVLDVAGG